MTSQLLAQKYFGDKKTAEPFMAEDKIALWGAPAGALNPTYLASDSGATDLFTLLRPFFPSIKIVAGSPFGSWGETFTGITLSADQTAHWFELNGYNEFNAFVTIHILAGPLLESFSRMNPIGALNYVIGQINFALALEPSPTES